MMRGQKFKWGNESIFLIVSVFYGLGTSFLSEGYVQAYLIELGMGVREIGLYGTLGYIAALASYALFSLYKPKGGDYLPMMFMAALSLMLFPLILAAAGLFPALSMIVLFGSALYQFMAGFRGSCDYSVVPRIMPRSRYGGLSGKCGLIGSALAAVMSAVSASVVSGEKAMAGYMTIFLGAGAALLISALAIRAYKPTPQEEKQAEEQKTKSGRFTAKNAWILLPHLLRGIASGGFYYFVVVSLERVTLDAAGSSLIVTVGVVGSMMGCLAFMQLEKRLKTGTVTLIGNLMAGLFAVLTAFNTSPVMFFVLYFGYMMFNNVSAYAIPAGVMYSVAAEDMPFISSMRMLMMSGGSTIFIQIFAFALTGWPAWIVMTISAAVYAAAGIIFKIQYTDALKE